MNNVARSRVRRWGLAAALAAVVAVFVVARSLLFGAPLPLRSIGDFPLSGDTSRLDYESLDPQRGLLFIAHLGAGNVIAFDTKKQRVAATIAGTPAVRGVLAVPELHRVYAAAQGTQDVVVIDEETLRIIGRVQAGDVDGLAYDPKTKHVFVSDEAGGRDVVIDTAANRVVTAVELAGEAGNTQYDPGSGHIFVAVQTRNQVAEIDPRDNRIVHVTSCLAVCMGTES